MSVFSLLADRLGRSEFTRVVAFGSSNTERRIPGMHWFDCFELAAHQTFGPHLACINSGHGGDTTTDLISRFERDCLSYQPHLVFITIGGNDAARSNLSEYEANLRAIISTLRERECAVVLQTYYAMDMDALGNAYATTFFTMMALVRHLSTTPGCALIDHLARWELLRLQAPAVYQRLMLDHMHVNETGNLLIGLDVARAFSIALPEEVYFREARTLQCLVDELAADRSAVCR